MELIEIILFIFPAYIANSAPVIFSGGGPLDLSLNLPDKRRLLGDSKTVRGTIGGLAAGFAIGALLSYFIPDYLASVTTLPQKLEISALMVSGAIFGDLLGSFFKRRLNIRPGEPLFVTDQLLFILTAILFTYLAKGFYLSLGDLGTIIIITLVMHILANVIAHKLSLKKVPW
ncbi:MAG TPA: CDP-2,3-bis-(O-geranylgeranyl)-sn-glycerol synthase [Candidatus Norongarragalinales archaeon]|nr:CDP-2,3-bis-(O-geranylgeranyl)-sn-glycerol synthase [Candidatus Norongarragalinales archaeon]